MTHCSAPWRPTRDLCWDTAWRRGTLRLESTLGCNIQANSSGWLWPRPTSTQRSYHPTFLSYLLHSYTLSLLTKPSLLPLVLPHWQRAPIFFVIHRIFYKPHVWIQFTPIRWHAAIQCQKRWQITRGCSYASDFISRVTQLWNRHNQVKLKRTQMAGTTAEDTATTQTIRSMLSHGT